MCLRPDVYTLFKLLFYAVVLRQYHRLVTDRHTHNILFVYFYYYRIFVSLLLWHVLYNIILCKDG